MTARTKNKNRIAKHLPPPIPGDGANSLPPLGYNDPLRGEMDLRDDERRIVTERATLISLAELDRHPQNRRPSQASIDERAKSLAADGQLQDVEVRKHPTPGKGFQILSGETRVLAARKLGWKEIRCTVVECDDAEALRLVALHNGQRADLNPIEKAELIESLCKPVEEGGTGATREEAARAVGLASGSAASNLVRLLKLPKPWRERVASGELPESFARLLAPVAHIAPIMDELEKDWKSKNDWDREQFQSRDGLEDAVEQLIREHTRRLDGEKRWYGSHGHHPCLLAADEIEGNRKALAIVTLTVSDGKGKTKDVEVATNAALFDELQTAILQRRAEKKAAKTAAAVGAESKTRPKSKSDLARAAAERERQLANAIERWQERIIRREVAAAVIAAKSKVDVRTLKLITHFAAAGFGVAAWNVDARGALENLTQVSCPATFDAYRMLSSATDSAKNPASTCHAIAAEFCAWLLVGDDKFAGAGLSRECLDALFVEWGCEWTDVWTRLYVAGDAAIEEFLELHRKEELEALGEEWGVHIAGKGKKIMLQMLLGRTSPLRLPKSLQPAKARAKKGGR